MGHLKYFSMAIASILNFFMPVSMVANPNCDYYQNLIMGQEYYIYNQEYPSYYPASTSCQWVAYSGPGTRIVMSCDVRLPSTQRCSGDRLAISLSGNQNFSDSRNYCGVGQFSLVSYGNAVAVGLHTTSNSIGGRFLCTLTAIQDVSGSTTETPPSVCDCGWKQETRIVGGQDTGVNEFPEMAGIVDSVQRRVYCGGTIISEKYVVTAAHCLFEKDTTTIGVLVGDHDLSTGSDTPWAALYPISAYELHPDYNSTDHSNDIALIQTVVPMNFSSRVGPACLPFRYTTFDFGGQVVTALGWGQLEFSGPQADTLQKVNLTVIPNNQCAQMLTDPVTGKQLCTYAEGKDACLSDSGGPLLWMEPATRRLQLVGVISFGIGCATTLPGVNTRVTSYLAWIISRTSDATYCIK